MAYDSPLGEAEQGGDVKESIVLYGKTGFILGGCSIFWVIASAWYLLRLVRLLMMDAELSVVWHLARSRHKEEDAPWDEPMLLRALALQVRRNKYRTRVEWAYYG